MRRVVDISSEMGEGFALPPLGLGVDDIAAFVIPATGERFHRRHGMPRHDESLLPYLTSVSLACGQHSGDPVVLNRQIPRLIEHGIRIGAHPSYPDVFRFGQNRVELTADELESVLLFQFGALAGVLRQFGLRVEHVKCHGALSFDVAYEQAVCASMISAIMSFDPGLILVLPSGCPAVAFARSAGITVAQEGFIDRGYDDAGRLVPRRHPKALREDPREASANLVDMVCNEMVRTVTGGRISFHADTYCLHSDTPGADAIIAAACAALREAGVGTGPLADVVSVPGNEPRRTEGGA